MKIFYCRGCQQMARTTCVCGTRQTEDRTVNTVTDKARNRKQSSRLLREHRAGSGKQISRLDRKRSKGSEQKAKQPIGQGKGI